MALNNSNADAILKEVYADVLENLTYKNRPALAMIPKGQWDGDTQVQALVEENTVAGASNTFANALTNKGNSTLRKFSVTLKEVHTLGSVSDVTIEVSKNRRGAFVEALKHEVQSGMNAINNKIAAQLFRSGGGAIGQVGSVSATSLTLKDPEDVVNFGVGMVLQGDTVDGGGTVHSGTEPITAINRRSGVLTAAAWTDISGIAANDFLFQDGDYDAALTGIAGWVPASDPGATAFFGLDRTTDLTRLSGVRVLSSEVSGLPVEEKLQHLLSRIGREGGAPDVIFMNYANLRDLEISLGSKVQYVDAKAGEVGFRAVSINGPTGMVKVVADRWCPNNRAYALQLDTWKLLSTTGGAAALQEHDGGEILREGSANNYEFRIRFYGNLVCSAPGFNGVVDLS